MTTHPEALIEKVAEALAPHFTDVAATFADDDVYFIQEGNDPAVIAAAHANLHLFDAREDRGECSLEDRSHGFNCTCFGVREHPYSHRYVLITPWEEA